jgi:hypothetical protein
MCSGFPSTTQKAKSAKEPECMDFIGDNKKIYQKPER